MPKALGERIYLTSDGKHVREGHPDAAFLAYALDDEVPDKVVAELGRSSSKSRKPAEDKSQSKPADKSGGGDGTDADHPKSGEADSATGEDKK